jgi:hypothetical protein
MNVWIVDVDGTRLFIAGVVQRDDNPGASGPDVLTDDELAGLEREIQEIIDPIEFGPVGG